MGSTRPRRSSKVVILGAGTDGLAAAKIYLQLYPLVDLTIIDSAPDIGGVWAKSRIYPGLIFEFPTPFTEFSDLDMCKQMGVEKWSDIPGELMYEYLTVYTKRFSLLDHCRLNTEVVTITRSSSGSGWTLVVKSSGKTTADTPLESLTCDKLILSTGFFTKPKWPNLDTSAFSGLQMHSVSMGLQHQSLQAPEIQNVTVIGGHKSALEAVGFCARAGKTVTWLIRPKGGGPSWMAAARDANGSVGAAKTSTIRAISIFSPSVYFSESRFLNRFLFSERFWLGTWLLNWFWRMATGVVKGDRYEKSENVRKLEPHVKNMFWFVPGATSLHDQEHETLRLVDEGKRIKVYRSEIQSVQSRSVTLTNGDTHPSDALIFCTGWQPTTSTLFDASLAHDLGLPVPISNLDTGERERWRTLSSSADKKLLDLYFFAFRISIFETPEYFDQLLRDLGVRAERKAMRTPGSGGVCLG